MTDSDEVKLLPCPLCGDKDDYNPSVGTTYKYANPGTECTDLVESGHMIECDKCGCSGPIAPVEEEAVRLWNTRPPVVTDEVVERVAEQMHYAACAFGGNTTVEVAAQQFPWEKLDERRREGVRCMARASMPAVVSGGQT